MSGSNFENSAFSTKMNISVSDSKEPVLATASTCKITFFGTRELRGHKSNSSKKRKRKKTFSLVKALFFFRIHFYRVAVARGAPGLDEPVDSARGRERTDAAGTSD